MPEKSVYVQLVVNCTSTPHTYAAHAGHDPSSGVIVDVHIQRNVAVPQPDLGMLLYSAKSGKL